MMSRKRPDRLKFSQQAMEHHQANLTKEAKELGLTRTTLYRWLDKHAM